MPRTSHNASLANVRTHTTRRASASLARHELYMKLTSLEIEYARRSAERDGTVKRMTAIDERLARITAEKEEIQKLLDDQGDAASPRQIRGKNDGLNLQY